jgi:hypothetical protein
MMHLEQEKLNGKLRSACKKAVLDKINPEIVRDRDLGEFSKANGIYLYLSLPCQKN